MQQPQKVQIIVGFSIHYRKLNHPQLTSSPKEQGSIVENLKKTLPW